MLATPDGGPGAVPALRPPAWCLERSRASAAFSRPLSSWKTCAWISSISARRTVAVCAAVRRTAASAEGDDALGGGCCGGGCSCESGGGGNFVIERTSASHSSACSDGRPRSAAHLCSSTEEIEAFACSSTYSSDASSTKTRLLRCSIPSSRHHRCEISLPLKPSAAVPSASRRRSRSSGPRRAPSAAAAHERSIAKSRGGAQTLRDPAAMGFLSASVASGAPWRSDAWCSTA